MNSGPTAERVYDAIRLRIMEGAFRPGERLDAAVLAAELSSSVTPVRDALHLLTGQGLVETRTGDGFRLPLVDAPALQDLYEWNGQVLASAVRARRRSSVGAPGANPPANIVEATAQLFARIAAAADNVEHERAIGALNRRLHAARIVEATLLGDVEEELAQLLSAVAEGTPRPLLGALSRYHRRRHRGAAEVVRGLYRVA